MELMKTFASTIPKDTCLDVIDVGACEPSGNYRGLFQNWNYRGLDIVAGPNVDIVVDTEGLWEAIPDNSVDVFISGQAFEHMRWPWVIVQTMYRKLKPQTGLACISAPNQWHLHRHPIDCWRFFPDGMQALLEWANFKVLRADMVGTDTIGVGQKAVG
jgi:SAM-dependent methyltransferase